MDKIVQDIDGEGYNDGRIFGILGRMKRLLLLRPCGWLCVTDSGHVRIFQYNETNYWNKIGQDIDGEIAGDQSVLFP